MKILIVDDHFLVLEGLALLLRSIDFVAELRQAQTVEAMFQVMDQYDPDVLFLDLQMGKNDTRTIIPLIKKQYPGTKIIVLTSMSDTPTIRSCFKSGTDAFLLKTDGRDEIIIAIQKVMVGERYYSSQTRNFVFENEVSDGSHRLSEREKEIVRLIAAEKTNKEIASELFISEKTVENHRANIMLKMDVKNVAGLIRKCIQLGIVQ